VRRDGVTPEELERVKARLELGTLQGLETVSGKAEQLGFYETVLGDPAALFEKLGAYRRATLGDLLRVARRYLVDTARTIVEVLPDGSGGEGEAEGDEDDEDEDNADDAADDEVTA
jgi:zinc protease